MARGEDTGHHPGRRVGRENFMSPQEQAAAGLADPTTRSDMNGFAGPKCHNCGSYNTDISKFDGNHDCYDCGHTSVKE
jgi:hypothetical protein